MSTRNVETFDRARKRWPDQPLIAIEIEGDLDFYPIGHQFAFTHYEGVGVTLVGIFNADGSVVVVRPKEGE